MTRAGPFQHLSAGSMSLLVHGVFIAFLMLGVTWRSLPHLPVEAELWSDLPEPVALEIPSEPAREPPPPETASAPDLAKAAPGQAEAVAKATPEKPDIALERAEKKRQEQELREAREREALAREEEARREEAARLEESRRQAEEAARVEKARAEAAEALQFARRERARKLLEQDLARQAEADLAAEEAAMRGALRRQREAAGRNARLVGEFQDRIRSKILGYVRLPHNLTGNPEVVFRVMLLPNGEILRVILLQSSGQPAYDQEMERAILKASPLPLPQERDVAAAFREDLRLKFRPGEQ